MLPGSKVPRQLGARVLWRDGMALATLVAGNIEFLVALPTDEERTARKALRREPDSLPLPALAQARSSSDRGRMANRARNTCWTGYSRGHCATCFFHPGNVPVHPAPEEFPTVETFVAGAKISKQRHFTNVNVRGAAICSPHAPSGG